MEITFELIQDLKPDSRMFWLSKCSCKELKELVATKLTNRNQRREVNKKGHVFYKIIKNALLNG